MKVEVDETDVDSGAIRACRGSDAIQQAKGAFDDAIGMVKPATETIIAQFRTLSDPPDQASIEFGIKLNATAGAVIASTQVEANFQITLEWHRATN
jgi:hypothetical protein